MFAAKLSWFGVVYVQKYYSTLWIPLNRRSFCISFQFLFYVYNGESKIWRGTFRITTTLEVWWKKNSQINVIQYHLLCDVWINHKNCYSKNFSGWLRKQMSSSCYSLIWQLIRAGNPHFAPFIARCHLSVSLFPCFVFLTYDIPSRCGCTCTNVPQIFLSLVSNVQKQAGDTKILISSFHVTL